MVFDEKIVKIPVKSKSKSETGMTKLFTKNFLKMNSQLFLKLQVGCIPQLF